MKGYKVFNSDWTCRGFQYKVGEIFVEDVSPSICERGFHFCEKLIDCFKYYEFNPANKVAEVLALGEIVTEGDKSCTNKIQIVREIPWAELLEIVNTEENCTGYGNSGSRNSGNHNSGSRNSGNHNSGSRNSGNHNSGDYNSGHFNSGDYNSGDCNSGNHNSGSWNSGDWNSGNFSSGCFNTVESKIYLFNKPSKWTYRDWLNSAAHKILSRIPKNEPKYIYWEDMNDKEKEEHPEAEITGGYLKECDASKRIVTWWNTLPHEDKYSIISLPNFDKEIFKRATGIDVDIK